MARLFKNIAAIVFVLCFVKSAGAETPRLSADDTVTYINDTLHKFPTLEFVDSGCPGYQQVVTISADRRSLIIQQNFGQSSLGNCGDIQTLTVPVFSLNPEVTGDWSKAGQHSAFILDCVNSVDCFSRRSTPSSSPVAVNRWSLQMTAPDQTSKQLGKAIQHLLDSLLTEARAHLDANDPFAKRAH